MFKRTFILVALGFLAGAGCSGDKATGTAGGDATETGNAFIRGKLADDQGRPMDSTEVRLFSSMHNPLRDKSPSGQYIDTTDSQGEYAFDRIIAGTYQIQGISYKDGQRVLIKGVTVMETETLQVAIGTMRQPGILDLFIEYSLRDDLVAGHVYIPGTSVSTAVGSYLLNDGHIIMGPVAAGVIPAIHYTRGSLIDTVLVDTVTVMPGLVTRVVVPDRGHNWPHKQ